MVRKPAPDILRALALILRDHRHRFSDRLRVKDLGSGNVMIGLRLFDTEALKDFYQYEGRSRKHGIALHSFMTYDEIVALTANRLLIGDAISASYLSCAGSPFHLD